MINTFHLKHANNKGNVYKCINVEFIPEDTQTLIKVSKQEWLGK